MHASFLLHTFTVIFMLTLNEMERFLRIDNTDTVKAQSTKQLYLKQQPRINTVSVNNSTYCMLSFSYIIDQPSQWKWIQIDVSANSVFFSLSKWPISLRQIFDFGSQDIRAGHSPGTNNWYRIFFNFYPSVIP